MRYKNIKTGAVIDSPCSISGANWFLVEEQVTAEEEIATQEAECEKAEVEPEDNVITLSEMTVASLKKFAAENDIDLGKATKRDDIIKVIMESDAVEIE